MSINKDKIVKTFDGTEALRSECRNISGKFYKMGVQCVHMSDGKWHRINNGLVDFDHEKKKWVLKSGTDLYTGVVEINNNELIFGKFTRNPIKNIEIIRKYGDTVLAISEDILTKDFIEILSNGKFIKKSDIDLRTKTHTRKAIGNRYPFRLNYSFEHQYATFKQYYEQHFKFERNPLKRFYKELGNTTYGVEFETYDGQIPVRHCYKTGLIPLRDGSLQHDNISPFEYTTIPLEGERGFYTLQQNCSLLNKYCKRGVNGSLHIHIGNIPRTPEYGIGMYRLLYQLQPEIYSMFPKYYSKTSLFKPSGKDYCQPLPNIPFKGDLNKDLSKLFRYYINGRWEWGEDDIYDLEEQGIPRDLIERASINNDLNFQMGMPHPHDSTFDHKWYTSFRYKWCNLIPLFFNNRNTVEFRIHTPTFNFDKVINWLFIVAAICKYANKYQIILAKRNTNVTLEEVLEDTYSNTLANYLKSYTEFRKEMMEEHSKIGDKIGEIEITEDSLDKWNYPIKSLI